MSVGSLPGGESQVIRLALVAVQGGPQAMQVRAVAGDLQQSATATILVAAPNLKVAAEGPSLRYIGRDATYRVRVTNDGGAAANNVRVACAVADGFRFVRADKGGRFEADASQVLWYVGRIEAGQSIDLAAELNPTRLGRFQQTMTVVGEQGLKGEAVVSTEVDGTASLLVEIVDLDDPVEVGVETAYEIRVKNEGTKAAKNVDVACKIPPGVKLVSAKGPTTFRDEGPALAFDPVSELAPRQGRPCTG